MYFCVKNYFKANSSAECICFSNVSCVFSLCGSGRYRLACLTGAIPLASITTALLGCLSRSADRPADRGYLGEGRDHNFRACSRLAAIFGQVAFPGAAARLPVKEVEQMPGDGM